MGWMLASVMTWHVATTGNDAAAGDESAPLRTIQRAADRAAADDVVIVHDGTYAGFVAATSGVTFRTSGAVTVDGAQTAERDAILVQGASRVAIEGFRVIGARRAGIAALDCDHVTVRGNRVDANARWGVFSSFCDDLVVEGNEVSRSGTEHGVYASNSADRPVIRDNRIWGNAMCGVHMNGDINFGGDGVISNALVEDNVITDNGRLGGSAINGDGITDAVIRNNVLDGNHASGISLYREDGGAPSTGNQVINNTIAMASDARWAVNLQNASGGNTLRNNILIHPARGAIDACSECLAGLISDHNAMTDRFSIGGTIADLAAWRTATGGDAGSFAATDAELFDTGALTLRAGSPAIDTGSPLGAPATDLTGTARPQGPGIDLGAYERTVTPDPGDDFSGPPADEDPVDPPSSGGCDATHPSGGMMIGLALIAVRRRQGRVR